MDKKKEDKENEARVYQAKIDEVNKKEAEKREEQARANHNQALSLLLVNQPEEALEETEKKDAKLVVPSASFNNVLIDNYKKYFNRSPKQSETGETILLFEDLDEAVNFFTEQAKASRSFLCLECGKGLEGHCFYSCGDGKLYQGSVKQIINDLETSIKENPQNQNALHGIGYLKTLLSPNPAIHYRGQVKLLGPEEDEHRGFRPSGNKS